MIEPKNLLIVRTDRIGDVVLTLPLAGIVKKYYPDCRITLLLKNYTKSLAEGHPYIDDVLIAEEQEGKMSLFDNIRKIGKFNFDTAIVVNPTLLSSLILFFSGINNRIGTGYRWYSLLFNYKSFEHRKYGERHELEFNINLLRFLGINEKVKPGAVSFDLQIDKASDERVRTILKIKGIDLKKPVIIVHPGSGGSAVDLPRKSFKELIKLINSNLKAEIILTGSKEEMELCQEIHIAGKTRNLAGLLNLSDLTTLINSSDIFIANSTGPLHIAAALGKYVIGFYPKIAACSKVRWGPYTDKSYVFTPNLECTNCTREQCERLNCMSSIKPEEIFTKVENFYYLIVK
jgi:lipopolysaccharide heptosyltransferase II